MTQLGGHALYLDWRNTNFGLADLGDEVRVLSYAGFIVARLMQHDDVLRAAEASTAPIMNGCQPLSPSAGPHRPDDRTEALDARGRAPDLRGRAQ